MSRIHLRREHDLTHKAARQKVEHVAELLAKRFDADCEWQGDVLSIAHPSVNGKVTLGQNDVVVEAKLGFMLAMFRDRIDEELVRVLDREFPQEKA
ncbi:MAG: polyhydroxyalkanoic acid system family protein [Steroidobacteraceae bacterium]